MTHQKHIMIHNKHQIEKTKNKKLNMKNAK